MSKKRILFSTEWSELFSGYGIYYKKLLERLYSTGKYEILELANYAKAGDPRLKYSKWEVIPVMPNPHDEHGNSIYNSNPLAQFGMNAFDDACLYFKPDIVVTIFDYWYSSYMLRSPFRNFFKLIWMPTVDSRPQRASWIDTYALCDKVCAYSYFGKRTLEEESSGRITDVTVCSPAVDEDYVPSDTKEALRKKMGIPKGKNIVMMVCRNQMRKLICDFVETLPIFIEKYKKKNPEVANNTLFYVHTSNPDSGWEIEQTIINSGYSKNILLTYRCKDCGAVAIKNYCGVISKCLDCGKTSSQMTSVGAGISRQTLADLMHIADIGVLMSIGEGWGMPLVEFKKVGTPIIAVPWSATEEQCVDIKCGENRHRGGIPVKIQRMITESATMQQRALFDREDLAKQIYKILTMKPHQRKTLSEDAISCVNEYFTWDRTAKIWEHVIDDMDIKDNLDWENTPPSLFSTEQEPPDNIKSNIEDLVRWHINAWYPHSYFTEHRIGELINSIMCGTSMIDEFSKNPFSLEHFLKFLDSMIKNHNHFETKRLNMYQRDLLKEDEEPFNVIIT